MRDVTQYFDLIAKIIELSLAAFERDIRSCSGLAA
jgi:hypothetical protein